MKKRIALILLAVIFTAAMTLAASAAFGSEDDPLISLSYLTETVLPDIMSKIEKKFLVWADEATLSINSLVDQRLALLDSETAERLESSDAKINMKLDDIRGSLFARLEEALAKNGVVDNKALLSATSYTALELKQGQSVMGLGGAIEVLPRSGSFVSVDPIGDGIVDMTGGKNILGGQQLALQTLYLIPRADQRGIKVTSPSGWILVRGSYIIVE